MLYDSKFKFKIHYCEEGVRGNVNISEIKDRRLGMSGKLKIAGGIRPSLGIAGKDGTYHVNLCSFICLALGIVFFFCAVKVA